MRIVHRHQRDDSGYFTHYDIIDQDHCVATLSLFRDDDHFARSLAFHLSIRARDHWPKPGTYYYDDPNFAIPAPRLIIHPFNRSFPSESEVSP